MILSIMAGSRGFRVPGEFNLNVFRRSGLLCRFLVCWAFLLCVVPAPALTQNEACSMLETAGWTSERAREIIDTSFRMMERGRTVAVFDHDHTLIYGDVTEGDGPNQPGLGRLNIEKQWKNLTPPIPVAPAYRDDPMGFYRDWAKREPAEAYGWICTLWAGQTPSQVLETASDYYDRIVKPVIFPEMKAMVKVLQALGIEVWVVSASAELVVRPAAAHFRIPEERILGVRLEEKNGIIQPVFKRPISFSAGKTLYIQKYMGNIPRGNLLVFGDSWRTDGHMLRYAAAQGGLALIVNPSADLVPTIERNGVRHYQLPSRHSLLELLGKH